MTSRLRAAVPAPPQLETAVNARDDTSPSGAQSPQELTKLPRSGFVQDTSAPASSPSTLPIAEAIAIATLMPAAQRSRSRHSARARGTALGV
jgi:hypothetical protein